MGSREMVPIKKYFLRNPADGVAGDHALQIFVSIIWLKLICPREEIAPFIWRPVGYDIIGHTACSLVCRCAFLWESCLWVT
jgi:hypothetical protein